MFRRFIQWLREAWNRMIGSTSVKQALRVDVNLSPEMADKLTLWAQMYENKAPWLSAEVRSLNLPAAIAGEIARSVTVEMQVEISGDARAIFLAEQFKRVMSKLRGQVEAGCAKGGLVFKPYVDGAKITVDFVQADMFYPVAFDGDGDITAAVFADQKQIGESYYTRLEYHAMTEAGCEIRNKAFKSSTRDNLGSEVSLATVDEWADLVPEAIITGVDRPVFAYFKFPLANNVDPASPLGVSCYSRATAQIEDADRQWGRLLWEMESGERALYVDVSAFTKDADGKPVLPARRLYRTLNQMNAPEIGEEGFFEEWSPEFREANILAAFDAALKRIEYNCGLAYGTLSDPQFVDKTATEIKTSKQRSAVTITDTQKALQEALEQLIWAIDVWATIARLAPRGSYATAFDFDDSLIVDSDAQFAQDSRAVGMGVMGKVEFRMRNYGESEEVAKEKIAAIQAEQPAGFFEEGDV